MLAQKIEATEASQDFSLISKGIYVGSYKSASVAYQFDVVVNCAKEHMIPRVPKAELLKVPLIDAPFDFQGNKNTLYQLYQVAFYLSDKILQGKKILFYCHKGWNRSALMAGLTMVCLGYPPKQAINLLRRRNSNVLSNQSFAEAIQYASRIGS